MHLRFSEENANKFPYIITRGLLMSINLRSCINYMH